MLCAFRMTAKLFSFRKEVLNRWIIIRNGTTRLGLFSDLISASFLGASGLLFTYHDKFNIVIKRCNCRLLLTGKRWAIRYTIKIYPFSQPLHFPYNFQDYFHVIYNRTMVGPKCDRSQKTHENLVINGKSFRLHLALESLKSQLRRKKILIEIKQLIFTDTLC